MHWGTSGPTWMDLLDMFAAHALAGIMANPADDDMTDKVAARTAYAFANAMMVERSKQIEKLSEPASEEGD
jgi:hypothetical protein